MSDASEGAPAPEQQQTATAPAQQPPAPTPPAPQNASDDKDPPWLSGRLDRHAKQILKDLGIDNPEDAKAALKAYREEQERKKSDIQRLTEENAALAAKAKRAEELEQAVKTSADAEMASLTVEQREAVIDIAGDDPAKQLRAIKRLAPTWSRPAPAAPSPTPVSNTAPGRDAPNGDTGTESPPDHKARYAQLKKENPVAAAYYAQVHQSEIFPR